MANDEPPRDEDPGEPAPKPVWKVDRDATRERLHRDVYRTDPPEPGGKIIYTDQHGHHRRLPAEMGELTGAEAAAAAAALSSELGAPSPDYARIAALERLNELRAAGAVSEENFLREKRRILGEG